MKISPHCAIAAPSRRAELQRIGDVVDSVQTWNPAAARAGTDIDYIDISAVDQEAKRIVAKPRISAHEAPSRARQLVHKGDVLVSTVRPNLNSVAMVPQELNGATASTGFCVLRPRHLMVDGNYLFHWVKSSTFVTEMTKLATGQSYPAVSDRIVMDAQLPLPPLAEQRRIAAILDAADALRQKRRQALRLLDQLSQSIFIEMFGDPATNPKGWPKLSLVETCNSPDDIKCGPFGTQLAKSEFRAEGVPLWGIKQVNSGFAKDTHEFIDEAKARDLNAYSLVPGDVVMTRKGTVGNCSVYPAEFSTGIMHSDLLRIRTNPARCNALFLCHQLQHSRDVGRQLALISGGAIMPGINVSKLKSLVVQAPPAQLQSQFAEAIEKHAKVRSTGQLVATKLDDAFASLQHRAFRGEL
jgi:type I restriction enzyme, S subunit